MDCGQKSNMLIGRDLEIPIGLILAVLYRFISKRCLDIPAPTKILIKKTRRSPLDPLGTYSIFQQNLKRVVFVSANDNVCIVFVILGTHLLRPQRRTYAIRPRAVYYRRRCFYYKRELLSTKTTEHFRKIILRLLNIEFLR